MIASAAEEVRRRCAQGVQGRFSIQEVRDRSGLERGLACQKPSLLFLDLALPHLGGIKGLAAILGLSPSTKTILLTDAPDEKEAIRGLKAGLKGYCNISIDALLLGRAVDVVEKGEIWVERKVTPHLLAELTSLTERQQKDSSLKPNIALDSLTARERQIAELVGEGFCNKEIANQFQISDKTVKAHLTSIFRKLNISDRLRLALLMAGDHRVSQSPHA